ncbi:DUF480 domain-containing protein [Cardiobacterium sp. AH-315-I02]|nr:DUF480 domain-containing protein [Cardiobacterium sp. AH-315-I02]
MLPNLTANESRVIGCLMEKSIYTPDQYPLTLNALVNACNQKTARNPVISLDKGVVQHVARGLRDKHLVHIEENFKNGVEKYKQRFCNTRFGDYQFDPPQFAIVCLLLLRGPQTPGEIRARSERLHSFADNTAVVDALNSLRECSDPLTVELPRTPGRKDSEYMHLFSGSIDIEAHARKAMTATTERASKPDLEQRVTRLEAEVIELRALLNS